MHIIDRHAAIDHVATSHVTYISIFLDNKQQTDMQNLLFSVVY